MRIFKPRWSLSAIAVLVSYGTCFPVCYLVNFLLAGLDPKWIPYGYLVIGYVVLATLFWAGRILSRYCGNGNDDWIRAGMFTFCFTCVVDLIIWLEFIGAINGYMTIYLKTCERYLFSSWGAAIGIFDAVGFYSMYHTMIYRQSCGKDWHSIGVYWAGGLLNSMFVEIFGALASKHQITVAILLNIPYFVLPFALLARVFSNKESITENGDTEIRSCEKFSYLKAFDVFLFLGLLISSYTILAKGMCGLGSGLPMLEFVTESEPFLLLEDPAPYGRIQAVLLLFWIFPIHCLCLWTLFRGSAPTPYLKQLVILQAGVMLHAQYNYIYPSLDSLSPKGFTSSLADPVFWFLNLTLFIVPHLMLARVLITWNSRRSWGTIVEDNLIIGVSDMN